MNTTYVNSSGTATGVGSNGIATAGGTSTSKTDFLKLLVTQLKNQDPNNAVDQTQMLAQLAQFSSLEQMQNLNETLSAGQTFSQMTQSAALIGKTVTAGTDPSTAVTGVVQSVGVTNGVTTLHIGSQDVDALTVTQVS